MRLSAMVILVIAVLGAASALTSRASGGQTQDTLFIRKKSVHTVDVTIDRLAAAVEDAGARVFARIDHAAGARSIGQELRPSTVLLFGNPRLGTPLMQAAPDIAFDLPLRAHAYEDAQGQVWLATMKPAVLQERYGITGRDTVFERMGAALTRLTDRAVAAAGDGT